MTNPRGRVLRALSRYLAQATLTRPDDTANYAAGDVIANATSEPSVPSIEVARVAGGSGTIRHVMVVDSSDPGTKVDLEIWLFSTELTAMEDNAAFDPTDVELLSLVTILDMGNTPYVGNPGADAAGNVVYHLKDLDIPFVCASGDKNLYWVPVVRDVYSPVSEEQFTLVLGVERD